MYLTDGTKGTALSPYANDPEPHRFSVLEKHSPGVYRKEHPFSSREEAEAAMLGLAADAGDDVSLELVAINEGNELWR